jgi:hypothetical protein
MASTGFVCAGRCGGWPMPRELEAAGADLDRVHVLPVDLKPQASPAGEHGSPFKAAIKAIEGAIAALEVCRLVVIDPLWLSIGRTGAIWRWNLVATNGEQAKTA